MAKKTGNLKEYLIVRLLFVMLFILLSEGLINLFISQAVFPALHEMFGLELASERLTVLERVGVLVQLLLYILGKSLYSVIVTIFPAPLVLLLQRILQNLEKGNLLQTPEKIDGVLLIIVISALILYVLPYIAGVVVYSMIVVRKMEEIRNYDKERNEEFIRRRNLLLSDIAHDLKTPITTISGYAQALSEGMAESQEKQNEYLQTIHKKSLQMNRLITVLFDYVKLDSEGFELKKQEVKLVEFIKEIIAEMYSDIEDAGMELALELPERECIISADKGQLARVFVNLLTNAIRHNPKGTGIRISLSEICGYEEMWKIEIADTGERIEEPLAGQLFEPFVMGDESRSRKAGSGLGLSIAAKIVEMHGGSLYLVQNGKEPYKKAFCIELSKSGKPETDYYKYREK